MAKNRRLYIGSTEPGARKIREKIESTRSKGKKPKDSYDDTYDYLISSEKEKETTEEGLRQLRELRAKQRKRKEERENKRNAKY